jgi:hypothetical protein
VAYEKVETYILNPDTSFQEYDALSIGTNVSKEFAACIFRVKEIREEITSPCLYHQNFQFLNPTIL